MSFWVTLNTPVKINERERNPICVNARSAGDVERIVQEHFPAVKVVKAERLPYPAEPQLNPGACPSFCMQPSKCAGRTSCPRDYACSE